VLFLPVSIKVKDDWHYLYRAVDKEVQTIDFMSAIPGILKNPRNCWFAIKPFALPALV